MTALKELFIVDTMEADRMGIDHILGCVPGLGPADLIDAYYTVQTPRCPANCTADTYYVPGAGICKGVLCAFVNV